MDVGLLDHYNSDGALTRIARVGGLVALGQLSEFLGCTTPQAYRAAQELADAKMCIIYRTPTSSFFVLRKAVTFAISSQLPLPPQTSKLRYQRIRTCVGRAVYFLKYERITHAMGDLSGRWDINRTETRISELVDRQVQAWRAQALRVQTDFKAAPTPALREEYAQLRRLLRERSAIINAGMASLRSFRGAYLVVDERELAARFVFIDCATNPAQLNKIAKSFAQFHRATGIATHLDIICSTEESKRRVEQNLEQTKMDLQIAILNLDFERYFNRRSSVLDGHVAEELQPNLQAAQ